ncbi:carbonic anhydrase [Chelatococcus asaccharovorans]|uniref:Carbonic anhydrase n=1 Tax=Chelatococcus asaccharovorans TaxID=28210 RepID=A0A2V3TUG0_9HYPH|nr:carbonic anhydrase [Chelatococcus asaccharovorans]MBS7702605.1 carbonic anhydrase [Chelatococcus asaccharovorans]PXW52208.1 carbonic anhydrase [Chelatococcus asaccharovorans]
MCEDHKHYLSRRHLIASGAAAAFLGGLALPATAQEKPPAAAPNAISPDVALKRIMDGNQRYAANTSRNKDYSVGRAARAAAQYPIAALLSCADARVAPELVFDQGPGELFIVRGAGNFVNDDGLASLEYGVKFLGTPLIMVLGHSGCGAVAATIKVVEENVTLPGHLPGLVEAIKPAVMIAAKAKAKNPLDEAIAENVRYNVRKLQEATPIIDAFVKSGKVKVVGGVYNIATGKVSLL